MPDALIWGASGAIGRAMLTQLKTEGYRVFAAARDESRVPDIADFVFGFNAGTADSADAVVSMCAYETAGFDVVVYAAGGLSADPVERLTADAWQATIDANLNGAFYAAKASVNLMNKGGHLLILGAYVHKITLPRMAAYAAAKAGLEAFVDILGRENRKLKVSLVRLPAVDTPFWQNVPFKLPATALQPETVAQRIWSHIQAGAGGPLDIASQ